jgi:hypothetical protein
VRVGDDVQTNQKTPAGRRREATNMGGRRASGDTSAIEFLSEFIGSVERAARRRLRQGLKTILTKARPMRKPVRYGEEWECGEWGCPVAGCGEGEGVGEECEV